MAQQNEFLAAVLKRGGGVFAGFAATKMLEAPPETAGFTSDPLSWWREWFTSRVEELAAGVSAGKPELFVERVRGAASLLASRNVPGGLSRRR